MRARIGRLVICHALASGGFALAATLMMTDDWSDSAARWVLAASLAAWTAVGSGITAFLLLNIEARERRRS